jgi:hypothetical protein
MVATAYDKANKTAAVSSNFKKATVAGFAPGAESKLSGAEAISSSSSITLTFSGVVPQGQFSVTVNSKAVTVNDAIRSKQDAQGQQSVTLLLPDGSLQAGDEVQVAWTGGNALLTVQ